MPLTECGIIKVERIKGFFKDSLNILIFLVATYLGVL